MTEILLALVFGALAAFIIQLFKGYTNKSGNIAMVVTIVVSAIFGALAVFFMKEDMDALSIFLDTTIVFFVASIIYRFFLSTDGVRKG